MDQKNYKSKKNTKAFARGHRRLRRDDTVSHIFENDCAEDGGPGSRMRPAKNVDGGEKFTNRKNVFVGVSYNGSMLGKNTGNDTWKRE